MCFSEIQTAISAIIIPTLDKGHSAAANVASDLVFRSSITIFFTS